MLTEATRAERSRRKRGIEVINERIMSSVIIIAKKNKKTRSWDEKVINCGAIILAAD